MTRFFDQKSKSKKGVPLCLKKRGTIRGHFEKKGDTCFGIPLVRLGVRGTLTLKVPSPFFSKCPRIVPHFFCERGTA